MLLTVLTVFFYFATMEVSLDNNDGLPITGFIFFEGGCIIALAFGVLLKIKMDSIYNLMMHDPEMMDPLDQNMRKTNTGELPGRFQIDLFWKRSPQRAIIMYQYMSFLYAFGGGFLALYASDITGDASVAITAITFSVSYLLNLLLVSYFMPRFTLCVSVG